MKISVVIPTYNSAAVIRHTLDAVLRQTITPDEILILDDGSTDETVAILKAYGNTVSVFEQKNQGVAEARNVLCRKATGDLIAFLDHDDVWHPSYLEVQKRSFEAHPEAVAFFTGNLNFVGTGKYDWIDEHSDYVSRKLIGPEAFIDLYNRSTGTFYSMSFCCMPKWIVSQMGSKPFCANVSGVDDCYICNKMPLHGSVVYTPAPLVAYRITNQAQSINQLKNFANVVKVFGLLEYEYRECRSIKLWRAFRKAYAGKRRRYGKTLMGAGTVGMARQEFILAAALDWHPVSLTKSLAMLMFTCVPSVLQPQ